MEQIIATIKEDFALLDKFITQDLTSDIVLINQISQYIIQAGGKRLRPLLTILLGNLVQVKNKDVLVKMATMIEYIHTATLIHDDIVDESGMRRNRPTSNAVFGNAASVLVGDFIYTRAFQLMCQANSLEILQIMADITNKISEGEVLQLLNIGEIIDEEAYFKVIEYKTAKLFEACAKVVAALGNCEEKHSIAITNLAVYLGYAFQIYDDVLDYIGDAKLMGKNIGDDLNEGKVTLPIIYALKSTHNDSEFLIDAIKNPHENKTSRVIQIVQDSGAIELVLAKAKFYVDLTIKQLDDFPSCVYKEALVALANYAINRSK